MIAALVLAAGRSRRMGTQKLLLPLGGEPVIARVVDQVLASPVDRTFVVIGRDGPAMRQALGARGVAWVTNPDPEGDMLSSVRCGLRALPPDCTGVLAVPGDHPRLEARVIVALVEAFRHGQAGLAVPTHGGRRGHPLLFAARYVPEVLQHHDGRGLRGLLEAHADAVCEVEVAAPGVVEDLDLPADYARLRARFEASGR